MGEEREKKIVINKHIADLIGSINLCKEVYL